MPTYKNRPYDIVQQHKAALSEYRITKKTDQRSSSYLMVETSPNGGEDAITHQGKQYRLKSSHLSIYEHYDSAQTKNFHLSPFHATRVYVDDDVELKVHHYFNSRYKHVGDNASINGVRIVLEGEQVKKSLSSATRETTPALNIIAHLIIQAQKEIRKKIEQTEALNVPERRKRLIRHLKAIITTLKQQGWYERNPYKGELGIFEKLLNSQRISVIPPAVPIAKIASVADAKEDKEDVSIIDSSSVPLSTVLSGLTGSQERLDEIEEEFHVIDEILNVVTRLLRTRELLEEKIKLLPSQSTFDELMAVHSALNENTKAITAEFIKALQGGQLKVFQQLKEYALESEIYNHVLDFIRTANSDAISYLCNEFPEIRFFLNSCYVESDLSAFTIDIAHPFNRFHSDVNTTKHRCSLLVLLTLDAVHNNDSFALLEELLGHGLDIRTPTTPWGVSLLGIAAFYGNIKVMKLLLEHDAEVNQSPRADKAAVVRYYDDDVSVGTIIKDHSFKKLPSRTKGFSRSTEDIMTKVNCLEAAIYGNSYEAVELLIERGAKLDVPIQRDDCRVQIGIWHTYPSHPIHAAILLVNRPNEEIIRILLKGSGKNSELILPLMLTLTMAMQESSATSPLDDKYIYALSYILKHTNCTLLTRDALDSLHEKSSTLIEEGVSTEALALLSQTTVTEKHSESGYTLEFKSESKSESKSTEKTLPRHSNGDVVEGHSTSAQASSLRMPNTKEELDVQCEHKQTSSTITTPQSSAYQKHGLMATTSQRNNFNTLYQQASQEFTEGKLLPAEKTYISDEKEQTRTSTACYQTYQTTVHTEHGFMRPQQTVTPQMLFTQAKKQPANKKTQEDFHGIIRILESQLAAHSLIRSPLTSAAIDEAVGCKRVTDLNNAPLDNKILADSDKIYHHALLSFCYRSISYIHLELGEVAEAEKNARKAIIHSDIYIEYNEKCGEAADVQSKTLKQCQILWREVTDAKNSSWSCNIL